MSVRSLAALAPILLAGCAISQPFSGPGWDGELITDAEGPFVTAVTHTRAAKGAGKEFDRHVDAVLDQMEEQPGFIGGSLRGRIIGREAWTMTVWEDEASLGAFVGGGAHLEAMVDASSVVDGVWSVTYSVTREEMPPSWSHALDELEKVEPKDAF